MLKVLSIFGTRPEVIKMVPVLRELQGHPAQVESMICVTAQHRDMLDQVLRLFSIKPDIDLNLMHDNQSPASIAARAMTSLTGVLEGVRPDLVLVQGDTTSAMAAALAAFYQGIPVGHVEAGLRTGNRYSPFPEEMNRHLIGVLATYHFAPTETAAQALRLEGVPESNIFVTGNTVIDTLLWFVNQHPSVAARTLVSGLGMKPIGERIDAASINTTNLLRTILVTAHRRESFGRPFENICMALQELVQRNRDVQIVYPVHMNPNVREPVHRILGGHERVYLIEPLPYEPFVHLMNQAYLILTDSGGIQEEAPSLGKPVLVMRTVTERPEAVQAGTVKVIGVDPTAIVTETERLLGDHAEYKRMAKSINPYGDGRAAARIVKAILERQGHGNRRISTHKSLGDALVQAGLPMSVSWRDPIFKRLFDSVFAGIGLVLSAPLWLLLALAIRLGDGGPVFYRQERVGRGGRRFRSWKFRSMVPDADQKYGPLQAGENDQRVTRVGRLLRATAMDELPQLWNIFIGEMSFVGPRALAPEEIEVGPKSKVQGSKSDKSGSRLAVQGSKFNVQGSMSNKAVPLEQIPGYWERHSVRPGLTGLAQIYAPRDIPRRHKFKYDLHYIKKQTFWLDLKLIAQSFWITARGKWESRGRKF